LFDKDQDGKVNRKELALIMRAIGTYPTEAELDAWMKKAPKGMEMAAFMQVLKEKAGNPLSQDRVMRAFSVFDEAGTGKCPAQEVRHVMTNLCERMSEEEVDELLQMADMDGDGNMDYKKLVSKLF
jgi:calmodulin